MRCPRRERLCPKLSYGIQEVGGSIPLSSANKIQDLFRHPDMASPALGEERAPVIQWRQAALPTRWFLPLDLWLMRVYLKDSNPTGGISSRFSRKPFVLIPDIDPARGRSDNDAKKSAQR
jgi:hypothetical protein